MLLKAELLRDWVEQRRPRWREKLADHLVDWFFRPGRKPLVAAHEALVQSARQEKVQYRGYQIQTYFWHGDGPLVFLAHGWSGSAMSFHSLIQFLRDQGFQVFAFDGVAHGGSEGRSTSFIEYIDLTQAMFDISGRPSWLIGHSMGGAALINAAHERNWDLPMVLLAPMYSLAEVLESSRRKNRLPRALLSFVVEHIELRFGRRVSSVEVQDKVKHWKKPSLVIHDPEDDVTFFRDSEALVNGWSSAELLAPKEVGHSRILRDEQVIQSIADFMSEAQNSPDE